MKASLLHADFWVGMDVAKNSFEAALAHVGQRLSDWSRIPVAHFEFTVQGLEQFAQWIALFLAQGECLGVCMESTGVYSHRLAEALRPLGLPEAAIVNPALPLAFRKSLGLRDKCDRVDAAVLALFGLINEPRPNTAQAPEYRALRECWRMLKAYEKDIRAWKNRLEQAPSKGLARELRKTIGQLENTRDALWREILNMIDTHPALRRDTDLLHTIPGIGQKTAIMIIAELGDLRTWRRKELVSYAGLFPKQYQSGHSVYRQPTLARGGASQIRQALFWPACSAMKHHPGFAAWRDELLKRGKAKKSAVCAVMRKLLLLMRAVLVTETPYDPEKTMPTAA